MTLPALPNLPPQKLAAGYFLAFALLAVAIVLWLRGFGRLLLPMVLLGGAAWVVLRIVRAIRAPLP